MAAKSNYVEKTVAAATNATGWISVPKGVVGVTVAGTGTFTVDLQTRFAGGTAITMAQYSDSTTATNIEFSGDPSQEIQLYCSAYTSGTPYMRLGYGV